MDNTINITLTDVKDFLKTLGLEWKGEIVVNNHIKLANSLKDFDDLRNIPATIKLYSQKGSALKEVIITETDFTFYQQSFDHSDIDATIDYEVSKDFSKEWVSFLLQRYENKYRNFVNEKCAIVKEKTLTHARNQLNFLNHQKKEVVHSMRAQLKRCQTLENIVNNLNLNK